MFLRSSLLRHSLHHRRRWEQRIAGILTQNKEESVDAVAQRFNRIYKERQFTAVEEAFPLANSSRWSGLPSLADDGSAVPSEATAITQPENPHVLRATVLGPQNAGKTSLVNSLSLCHVGAVSSRFGSTKDWTKAVATVHNTQLLLLDTPGVVVAKSDKDRKRYATGCAKAWDSIFVADLVVLALPAGLGFVEAEHKRVAREVVHRAAARELPVVLAVTMMDKVQTPRHRELYFSMRTDLEAMCLPIAVVNEVSVKGGTGLLELKDCLCKYAKPGPWEHYRREATDLSPVERVSEFLRQTYFELLPHEIPHQMRQRVIGWTRKASGTTEVVVEVFFDRPAYMFTFYSKLEAVCLRVQHLTELELKARYRFVFQGFISPGNLSHR